MFMLSTLITNSWGNGLFARDMSAAASVIFHGPYFKVGWPALCLWGVKGTGFDSFLHLLLVFYSTALLHCCLLMWAPIIHRWLDHSACADWNNLENKVCSLLSNLNLYITSHLHFSWPKHPYVIFSLLLRFLFPDFLTNFSYQLNFALSCLLPTSMYCWVHFSSNDVGYFR